MNLQHIEERLLIIFRNANGWLPESQLADMQSLVNAGEPGIALENFCTQLEEYNVTVPQVVRHELIELALEMGMQPSRWILRL